VINISHLLPQNNYVPEPLDATTKDHEPIEMSVKGQTALHWFEEALWDLETAVVLHREGRYNAVA